MVRAVPHAGADKGADAGMRRESERLPVLPGQGEAAGTQDMRLIVYFSMVPEAFAGLHCDLHGVFLSGQFMSNMLSAFTWVLPLSLGSSRFLVGFRGNSLSRTAVRHQNLRFCCRSLAPAPSGREPFGNECGASLRPSPNLRAWPLCPVEKHLTRRFALSGVFLECCFITAP